MSTYRYILNFSILKEIAHLNKFRVQQIKCIIDVREDVINKGYHHR